MQLEAVVNELFQILVGRYDDRSWQIVIEQR